MHKAGRTIIVALHLETQALREENRRLRQERLSSERRSDAEHALG